MTVGLDEGIAALERELEAAKAAARVKKREAKQAEALRDRLARRLSVARSAVRSDRSPSPRKSRAGGVLNPVSQAGPKNIKAAREALAALGGEATAAQITARMGRPHGSQVWALRALVQEGVIEETGVRVNRSMTYRMKLGTTRRGPGS